jgi:hypothetical protein
MIEEFKDWKGNAIKEGDEICFIKIMEKDYFGELYCGLNEDGTMRKIKDKDADQVCWKLGEYHKVSLLNGQLAITRKIEEYTFTETLQTMIMFSDSDCWVIGIKGISDKH